MEFRSLGPGPQPYAEIWDLQRELVEQRARDEIPDTFLFVEHGPVITRGRGLQWTGEARERAMPLLAPPAGTEYYEIERGGDLTWHGPGQLVLYPIVKLDGRGFAEMRDVTGFLRRIERATVAMHARFGLAAEGREGATGVWVGDRKTTSIGIAVRKWVTYHGAAVNVVNSLEPYRMFSPCGFASEVMTTLERLAPHRIDRIGWRAQVEAAWTECLEEAAFARASD